VVDGRLEHGGAIQPGREAQQPALVDQGDVEALTRRADVDAEPSGGAFVYRSLN
jgi:hypothetical protein